MDQVNIPVAKAHLPKPKRRLGSAENLIIQSSDFDEPLKDFEEYMYESCSIS